MTTIEQYGKFATAWCPGCGNFGILNALKQALVACDLAPHQVLLVSGIGQAAKTPHYLNANVFNGLHGRSLPAATGAKLANPELVVIAESGDGCMYGEGGNHFLAALRRNLDITILVHDNQVYGLTKGQASPTSDQGFVTKTQPHGAPSAAFNPVAVAAAMVPLAIGSQTNGSVIRPAAFCGVYGYKPTFGLISRHRVLQLSRPLDQIGVFARTIKDAALIVEAIAGFDENDPDTRLRARPALVATLSEEPPVQPRLAFVKTPMWEQADTDTQEAFAELVEHLGEKVGEATLPDIFNDAVGLHRTIMEADMARSFEREYESGRDKLSSILREMIERGRKVLAVDYNNAVGQIPVFNQALEAVFEWHDAILTPAATGEAPVGLESTGNPIFCTLWTLCGMPAITLPVLQGSHGMPMGVQLVGARGNDARLLRTARWLVNLVGE